MSKEKEKVDPEAQKKLAQLTANESDTADADTGGPGEEGGESGEGGGTLGPPA